MNDPAFVADMEKRELSVQYQSGEQLQAYVAKALETSPEIVATFLNLWRRSEQQAVTRRTLPCKYSHV